MPSFRTTVNLGANATNANVMAGSAFEFTPSLQNVEVAITQEAGAGTVVADVQFGPEIQIESASIATEAAVGRGPELPENIIVADAAAPGDRLTVRLRETAGVATDVTVFVRTEPVTV